jgi:transcriptional regulator
MYIPTHYLIEDQAEAIAFMRKYSFATIVTVKDNFPTATHLPFVIEEFEEKIMLLAHFARANSQWQEIIENQVLVIFQEPHAYISPTHYETWPNVPTWDYLSVQAYGKGEIITDKQGSFAVLEKLIALHEKEFLSQWRAFSDDYKNKMVNGIVAFKINVTRIEAKKKLNQKSSEQEKESIIRALEKSSESVERDLAEYMKNL